MSAAGAAPGEGGDMSAPARDATGKLPILYWEDFDVGDTFPAPWGRTVTEAHLLAFSGLSGDIQPLHVDDLYAARSFYGRKIAHGPLTSILGMGLQIFTQVWRSAVAMLEETQSYKAPVFVGDTVYSSMAVAESRPISNPEHGLIVFINTLTNQDKKVVCVTRSVMLLRRRPGPG
jgi:acyl dehydratase